MNNKLKKILAVILAAFIILSVVLMNYKSDSNKVYAAESAVLREGTEYLRVRKTPGGEIMTDRYGDTIYTFAGQRLTVLDRSNSAWYKVTFSYNGEQVTGYMGSDWIVITGDESDTSSSDSSNPVENMSDEEFENYLSNQGFPESYKSYLRDLHELHPSWVFNAVHTGIDWSTLVENERNKQGQVKNLVQCPSYDPHYNWRSTEVGYNAKTNVWYPYDGSDWFAASDDLVKYYLDPRTYLWENFIFVFESLSYQKGVQNQTTVESILKGTFMSNSVPNGESQTYSALIMSAADQTGVSPYHIASRIKQEMGSDSNVCATGRSSSFPGIFNLYNIGAYDSSDAVYNGLYWASCSGSYGRPWNSCAKSITGGAMFLGEDYINVGQDTLYTQKFNVSSHNTFWHQYMTNIQAPRSEALFQYSAYASNGLLDSTMVFNIPVYYNMPDFTDKPSDSGNPNDYLSSLSVSGYSLTPSFKYNTTSYSLIVPNDVSSVNVFASAVASSSKVSGAGKINLNVGNNTVTIKCYSSTGSTRSYTINIVRKKADTSSSSGTGSGNSSNNGSSSGSGTGSNNASSDNTKVHRGDLNGDGKITAMDIVKVQRLIVGLDKTSDESKALADVNGDGKISAMDIVKIQRHIIGLEKINW